MRRMIYGNADEGFTSSIDQVVRRGEKSIAEARIGAGSIVSVATDSRVESLGRVSSILERTDRMRIRVSFCRGREKHIWIRKAKRCYGDFTYEWHGEYP